MNIDPQVRERIKRLAKTMRRSAHRLRREAIHRYDDRDERRDAFLRRGEEAWRHYLETGLHATGLEVADWLSTWGDEDEAVSPTCHK